MAWATESAVVSRCLSVKGPGLQLAVSHLEVAQELKDLWKKLIPARPTKL